VASLRPIRTSTRPRSRWKRRRRKRKSAKAPRAPWPSARTARTRTRSRRRAPAESTAALPKSSNPELSLLRLARPPRAVHRASRGGARMLAVAHDRDAVHEDMLHTHRQLMRLLEGRDVDDGRGIEHHNVGIHAFAQ